MNLTEEQQRAVDLEGTNILVSAGAGSGKTRVLTDRVLRKVKEGVNIDSLIILTFTRSAASEMKDRIRQNIVSAIKDGFPLEEQLKLLDSALITTIDGFCSFVVSKYGYLYDKNDINLVDSSILKIEKKKILDTLIEELYTTKDKDFYNLLDTFSTKDDKSVVSNIKEYYSKVENEREVIGYLEAYKEYYKSPKMLDRIEEEVELLLSRKLETVYNYVETLPELSLSAAKYIEDRDYLLTLLTNITSNNSWDGIRNSIVELKRKPTVPKDTPQEEKDEYGAIRDDIKKALSELSEFLVYDYSTTISRFKSTYEYADNYSNILIKYHTRIEKYKEDNSFYEFSDIASLAYKIITEKKEVQDYFFSTINEILLDEYQDTSEIQDNLIKAISNGKNIYMVGDIKQSIYRFRYARPDLFKDKYDLYSEKDDKSGEVIDLTKNFRSRSEVLSDINRYMERIMDNHIGGIDYVGNQVLSFGNTSFNKAVSDKNNYGINILETIAPPKDENESNEKVKNAATDAYLLAYDILTKMNNKYQVKEKDYLRDCAFHDFCILIRSSTNFNLVKQVLEYHNIPVTIHKSESYVKSHDVVSIINLLKLIYSFSNNENAKEFNKEMLLASVLRSYIYKTDDDLIAREILVLRKNKYLNNILEVTELKEFYELINHFRKYIKDNTIHTSIVSIVEKFNILYKITSLDNIAAIEKRLYTFVSKAKELEDLSFSFIDYIEYLDSLDRQDVDIEVASATKIVPNTVNIMSIHKSKGLQFPVVYLPYFGSSFKVIKECYHRNFGFAINTCIDNKLGSTILEDIIENNNRIDESSELIRLLYVALTRAEEEINILSTAASVKTSLLSTILSSEVAETVLDNLEDNEKNIFEECDVLSNDRTVVSVHARSKYTSFSKLLKLVHNTTAEDYKYIPYSKLGISNKHLQSKSTTTTYKKNKIQYKIHSNNSRPVTSQTFSASEVITDKNILNAFAYGNTLHKYFECIDFSKDVTSQVSTIKSDQIKQMILNFSNTDLIKNSNIIKSLPEFEFIYEYKNTTKHGIIDLLLELDNSFIVIDFKTKDIDKDIYVEQVMGYCNYISSTYKKETTGYLYSILDNKFKKIL